MVGLSLSAKPWRTLRWLVLAPHPDDETLGAGALIAQTAKAGRLAGLVYLTDGSGSHETMPGRSGTLVGSRKREAATAFHRLTGNRNQPPVHLDWQDASPVPPGHPAFDRAARRLTALCRRWQVDALAVTARHEPHCDHEAAAQLAYAVGKRIKGRLVIAEYVVWALPPASSSYRELRTAPMLRGQRRHALAAHRSQLTASHGPGFRLPATRRAMPASDILYLRRAS
ncbi:MULTISPECIES: PIG-L deacetylase family protein [unclassified Sphingobium]|uniref:PIG-L deacetylase family protein n=1 Tax=unclassified Sphingobium TaxID=2611147 RepID=UPI001199A04B|nr:MULTISPECIES: PIG-L family deacetylase [unclassified Sphingobium]MBG6119788.1 LmbE family N-acetylglucosaminyl deacetylase [Sphingobium sp. JAI105]TWD01214.1 LmbE family N-acetylglucosaminyl deacetylase [Sphingobium sp. AEW010]TWD19916.1 LmbE family N-acetylglucosaminyl deacetylase [Sphingobium sp. AEW013]TWD22532.1 LmbE family N-acetylglucosaminyl deacetylase [Sphingobium sp. AEW001]